MSFETPAGLPAGTGGAAELPSGAVPREDSSLPQYEVAPYSFKSGSAGTLPPVDKKPLPDPAELGRIAGQLARTDDTVLREIYEALFKASRYRTDATMPSTESQSADFGMVKTHSSRIGGGAREWFFGSCLIGLSRMPEHWPYITLLMQARQS
jgi:hypothetical protein